MLKLSAIKPQVVPDPTGRIYYRKIDLFCEAIGTVILLLVVFFMFCAAFWLGSHYAKPITGSSMQPGINNYTNPTGDIAIVSNSKPFSYDDIIIVDMSLSANEDSQIQNRLLIKRAIAFGGDSLRLDLDSSGVYHFWLKKKGESAFVQLDESFITAMTYSRPAELFHDQSNWTIKCETAEDGSIVIPDGYMFFVGDNRNVSYDCRFIGPVETTACVGTVETVLKTDNFWNKIFSFISSLFATIPIHEATKG